MKVYDLTVKFENGEQNPRTYYTKSAAKKGLEQVIKNGYKVLEHSIISREATIEEKQILANHKKLMKELDEM